MNRLNYFWKAIVIAGVLCAFSFTVFAGALDEELENLQDQMSNERTKAQEAGKQVETVSEQLKILQDHLAAVTAEYEAIKRQLDDTEEQIDKNTEILEEAEKELAKQMKVLDRRIRDVYQNGQISYIDVLFGARDFSDFMTRMDLLKRVIRHDFDLIMKIKGERALILEKRAELERDKASIQALEKAAEEKRKQVEESKARQEEALDKAINDRDTAERAYQELLEASRQVEQMIRQSKYQVGPGSGGAQGGGTSTGSMIWPIHGEITSEYGWRTHPIFGTSKYHSGLDIGGDYGLPVAAADGGVVIYAGWISGYGNAVIIDHGGGLSTLYGHNDSLTVGEGQSVSQGQTIALCGSTGYSTGPHVHFEVRRNGSPVSPWDYLQ